MQTSLPEAVQQYPNLCIGGLIQTLSGLPVRSMVNTGVIGWHCEKTFSNETSPRTKASANIFIFMTEVFFPHPESTGGWGIFSVAK
jgi:hypothetical protein